MRASVSAGGRFGYPCLAPALGLAVLLGWHAVAGVLLVRVAAPGATSVAMVSRVAAIRRPAGNAGLVAGTPCTAAAKACVNLTTQQAWLINRGAIARGPVPIHSGGPGHATPQGSFVVSWKDGHHVSSELGGMPMPDAVFFAAGGIAFHQGSLASSSAGCVHLSAADAVGFYAALRRGDQVQVRAPGGDLASGVPATSSSPGAHGPGPVVPGAGVRAPRTPPGTGDRLSVARAAESAGRVQHGIPGVAPVGPAPHT
ncbi:MAG TPA: L,D-transpeptidase family protein [Pseudonocardia sp.]|jgi:hypothetical protein|uniref:L,D-transpeptidase family protein n=1 Tax=Pseudonocardia sp. TaxID=60912 RepID=UPI002F42CA1A